MHIILNQPPRVLTIAKATEIAAQMQADDDDWTYQVRPDPQGNDKAIIAIIDETGELIGKV